MRQMMNQLLAFGALILTLGPVPAAAFDPPVFPLNDTQLKALEEYQTAKGIKAFAAGPDGQFSAQTGFASASIAAREALKACDKDVAQKAKRCLLIDLDGDPIPLALHYAQMLRIDEGVALEPVPLRDLTFNLDVWRAYQGFGEKGEHKAFALSLKGVWARSWDAATIEEAEKEALEACNRNAPSGSAPCFIIARDRALIPGEELEAKPDLSVSGPKSQ
jgi:hypothetical protein